MSKSTLVTALWTLGLFIVVPLVGFMYMGYVDDSLTIIYAALIVCMLGACVVNYWVTLHLLNVEKRKGPAGLNSLKLQMKWEAEIIGASVFAFGLLLSIAAFHFAELGLKDALTGTGTHADIVSKVHDAFIKMFPLIPALLAAIGVGIANSKKLALARFERTAYDGKVLGAG